MWSSLDWLIGASLILHLCNCKRREAKYYCLFSAPKATNKCFVVTCSHRYDHQAQYVTRQSLKPSFLFILMNTTLVFCLFVCFCCCCVLVLIFGFWLFFFIYLFICWLAVVGFFFFFFCYVFFFFFFFFFFGGGGGGGGGGGVLGFLFFFVVFVVFLWGDGGLLFFFFFYVFLHISTISLQLVLDAFFFFTSFHKISFKRIHRKLSICHSSCIWL